MGHSGGFKKSNTVVSKQDEEDEQFDKLLDDIDAKLEAEKPKPKEPEQRVRPKTAAVNRESGWSLGADDDDNDLEDMPGDNGG